MAEAETTLRAAIELDPHAVVARLSLAPVYLATERAAEAEKICSELKTIAPDNPQAYQALGRFYIFTGQKEKAVAEFRAISQSKPKDSSVKTLLAGVLIESGQIKETEPLTRELLKAHPGDPQALLLRGRALIAEGDYRQALTELEKVVLKAETRPAGFYFLGVAQKALGFSSEARSSWVRALELQPQMTDAQLALADIDADAGNYEEALRLAGDALKAHPNLFPAYLIQARVLLAKGNIKEAEAALQAVLSRDPASVAALEMLVKLRLSEKRSHELLQPISKLAEQHPQNARLRFLQAVVLFSLNDLGNAEVSAQEAMRLDRPGSDAYTLLADIHKAQGSVEKAKEDLRAAISGNPRKAMNYVALEKIYESEGNWEEAKKLCERAREIDPDSPLVANNLAYLYLEHGGDVNVALSLAQAAKRKMPDSPGAADTLGWAYYKLGSPQSAVVHLRECARKAPTNPVYQYHLGMAYMAAGHVDSAKQSLQQALRDNPDFAYAAMARATLDRISQRPPQ